MGARGTVIPTSSIIKITMLEGMVGMGMGDMRGMEDSSHVMGAIKGMLGMAIPGMGILGMGRRMVMLGVKAAPEAISILISMEVIRPMGKHMGRRRTVGVAVVEREIVGSMD